MSLATRFTPFALLSLLSALNPASTASPSPASCVAKVTPAAPGLQLVRLALPLPKGLVAEGQTLLAADGQREIPVALRVLTWYPTLPDQPRSARRALVTFPYTFPTRGAVSFRFRPTAAPPTAPSQLPVEVRLEADTVQIAYAKGPTLTARLVAPARTSSEAPRTETVEANPHVLWKRIHLPDAHWPRILEVRSDSLGQVVVVAHLQRGLTGDGYAPRFGWDVHTRDSVCRLRPDLRDTPVLELATHSFTEGRACDFVFEDGRLHLYHPAAPFSQRGGIVIRRDGSTGLQYEFRRCSGEDHVPLQQAAWRRAELVVAPTGLAPLTATLEAPHPFVVEERLWQELYGLPALPDLTGYPELARLQQYHQEAIVRSRALGHDWGNVTGYEDGRTVGATFGMNRLNHGPPLFLEGYRSGDHRLLETAVLWCDNFHDLSIWWGPGNTGGTRYNNVLAQNRTPLDNDRSYMWRSNSAVHFCTKGYDTFWLAYEQTGDPRMQEALDAQVRYAATYVHTDQGECRNIGDVLDFIRLYEYTGRKEYLDQALRLFRELRSKLSAGNLFSQGGQPIVTQPPFIDDDEKGYRHPFAKPYIVGYALAGLPELARHAPEEPKLRAVIQAVADFIAESQDTLGGWRYPHPRSTTLLLNQALEHAWQLVQADRYLGAQEAHLDAIERVLRQRLHGWRKTGKVLAVLVGWERATGKVQSRAELEQLYQTPGDRDGTRDYTDGSLLLGNAPPEGLVYFTDVLAFYLQHRSAQRLLAAPRPDEPLGKVLARIK